MSLYVFLFFVPVVIDNCTEIFVGLALVQGGLQIFLHDETRRRLYLPPLLS